MLSTEADGPKVLPLAFEPLPLGSVKPLGWLEHQIRLMADGLPGHMHEFYRLIKDAPWLGGNQEYSCKLALLIFCWSSQA